MHPSLYALFCRSKYAKGLEFHAGEDERTIQRRHLQTERFAVAAIALCLKHDREFFGHFLRIVCGLNELDTPFDILVEDKRWGDLVLVAYDQSKVFVIECKIQASLENHQNPTHHSDEFWLNGYGKEITDRYSTQNTYIEYVVLGYGPKLEGLPYVRSNLKCSQVFWDDLKGGFPKTNLCSDLEMTLAALHVSAFRSGRTDRIDFIVDKD